MKEERTINGKKWARFFRWTTCHSVLETDLDSEEKVHPFLIIHVFVCVRVCLFVLFVVLLCFVFL